MRLLPRRLRMKTGLPWERSQRAAVQASEDDGGEHRPEGLKDVIRHDLVNIELQTLLRVDFPRLLHNKFVLGALELLLYRLVVLLCEIQHFFHKGLVFRLVLVEVRKLQAIRPLLPAQVQKHLLLQIVLTVIDRDGIVVAVEAVNERRYRGFVQMADVRRRLPGFLAEHEHLVVDEPETVNHDLALHRLDRIHHNPHGARIQLLEALLRVHVRAGEPATETGVRVVPAHDHLGPACLFQHVEHLCLENWINGLHAHAVAGLGHREDVANADGVVVDEFAKHQAHHLHGHSRAAVLQHLQQGQRGDVDLLRCVGQGGVLLGRRLLSPSHAWEVPEEALKLVEVARHPRSATCQ
mmetsp:Transcript_19836/g.54762  ORF Transcript_19836/g.54762 Transcript_19836/m.54762 type:complete len:352 (+) Transcript_19836:2-1057(+)